MSKKYAYELIEVAGKKYWSCQACQVEVEYKTKCLKCGAERPKRDRKKKKES